MTATSSSSTTYINPPLDIATLTAQSIQDRLTQADAALVARQTNISAETTRAILAESAEAAARAAADTAEQSRATTAEALELTTRAAAVLAEQTRAITAEVAEVGARVAGDTLEAASRTAGDIVLQDAIDVLSATASTSGGTAFTTLTRNAGAATIASIGGDGTTTTVTTSGAHGFVDGDFVTISGTANYNGASAAINKLSTTQFTFASAVNAATETTGSARTVRLFVASTANFVVGQQLTVTSDTGQLHTTTVATIPTSGQITMAAAVPATWTLTNRASATTGIVSTTLEEVRLMRTAIGSAGNLTAPQALSYAAGGIQHVMAWGAKGDGTTDDTVAIAAAITAATGSLTNRTVYFPAADYVINTTSGSGRSAFSLLITASNLTLRGERGSRLLFKNGSTNRPFILRACSNVTVEGLKFIYDRADGDLASGICIQNSSDITVRRNVVDGFTTYGVVVSEDTSTAKVGPVSTVSFNGHTIADSANGLGSIAVGNIVLALGALNSANRGIFHVTAAAAGSLTVTESLTTEAAGASSTVFLSTTMSFNSTSRQITDRTNYPFLSWEPDEKLRIAGSTANNNDFTVEYVSPDGGVVRVTEALVTEAAGASVTVSKINTITLVVWNAAACNNIVIEQNDILNIGSIGIEGFGKVLSYNHVIQNNYVYNCGNTIGVGAGIKAGQGVVGAKILNNHVAHCANGIAAVNWETMKIAGNQVHNCQAYGIAVTCSRHPMYTQASFGNLHIQGNQLAYVLDYVTGSQFAPVASSYAAININGLYATPGLIDIDANPVHRWTSGGISFTKTLVEMTGIAVRNNRFVDSGSTVTVPLTGTADTASGSPTLANVTTGGVNATAGWYEGGAINGVGIPDGTTILTINAATRTITMSASATATATGVTIGSGRPLAMTVENNVWEYTGTALTRIVRLYGKNQKIVNNLIRGFGPLALQVRGDGSLIKDNVFTDLNPSDQANVAPILLDEGGTYTVVGNHHHSSYPGIVNVPAYLVNNNGAAGGTVTVVADDTNRMVDNAMRLLYTGTAVRLKRSGQLVGTATWDPASLTNGSSATTTVTVANANVGDVVIGVGFTSITAGKWGLRADITSSGTATITLTNNTGGTVDLASGTLTVLVSQL